MNKQNRIRRAVRSFRGGWFTSGDLAARLKFKQSKRSTFVRDCNGKTVWRELNRMVECGILENDGNGVYRSKR